MSETTAAKPPETDEAPAPVSIKKYANRRLYDTAQSAYVTLDALADMVRREIDFVVTDARTGEDITRQVLTQIIFEEETRGAALLPVPFLRQLIGLYGGGMQAAAPSYLEASLDAFVRGGERLRDGWMAALSAGAGKTPGADLFAEQVRANMALFDQTVRMFTPRAAPALARAPEPPAAPADDALSDLTRRMEEMQRQLAELSRR
ncbi:MAG: polyhydroxyalkanoate synthesis repressor PhaR [Caulobacteraceae bacterium]|nr:polyhydroxyalkanoate synthesis repressor PhaR [Caulobacter sp.]